MEKDTLFQVQALSLTGTLLEYSLFSFNCFADRRCAYANIPDSPYNKKGTAGLPAVPRKSSNYRERRFSMNFAQTGFEAGLCKSIWQITIFPLP